MKKKILGMALAAMALVAFNSNAQTATTASKDNAVKKECVNGKKCTKEFRGAKANPFEGMNLTEAQKTKLQQLDDKRKADHKAKAEARKSARKADKQAGKQMSKEMKAQAKEQMRAERKAAKKAYLAEVKSIVGNDNYVTFLENSYMDGGKGKCKAGMGKGKGHKDGKGKMLKGGKKHGDRKGKKGGDFAKNKQRKGDRAKKTNA